MFICLVFVLPGHLFSLQRLMSVLSPMQGSPPKNGPSHTLCLCWLPPPHVLLQLPQELQESHLPSTTKSKQRRLNSESIPHVNQSFCTNIHFYKVQTYLGSLWESSSWFHASLHGTLSLHRMDHYTLAYAALFHWSKRQSRDSTQTIHSRNHQLQRGERNSQYQYLIQSTLQFIFT